MRPAERVLALLAETGLLLTQDKTLPNVVSTVTGETPRGSWWSHPKGREVFAVLSELADHEDVLLTKLLLGKDTFVHRRLWPALLAVGSAQEPWQLKGLSVVARRLRKKVEDSRTPVRATGTVAKLLLSRLLVVGCQEHTESGTHAMALESWRAWSARTGCRPASSAAAGRRKLEDAVKRLGGTPDALPWTGAPRVAPPHGDE
jgi:hypothetical protein